MDAHPERSNERAHARHTRQRIEFWPIKRPIPYEGNPRNCPPEANAEVARCCALELSPAYCDVAVRHWEAFTGRKASCHGPGH